MNCNSEVHQNVGKPLTLDAVPKAEARNEELISIKVHQEQKYLKKYFYIFPPLLDIIRMQSQRDKGNTLHAI
jgi:hypothetical protein